MMRATLILTLNERVVFSLRGATEGDHKTLDYIPGSTLLGWAASQLYSKLDKKESYELFHSGKVRFSNGYPLSSDGFIGLPIPEVLTQPKEQGSDDDKYLSEKARVCTRQSENQNTTEDNDQEKPSIQYETIKDKYITEKHELLEPSKNRRLKTAIHENMAVTGQLFGYSHLEAGQIFVATIEGDIDPYDWSLLLKCFGRELRLGRSKRSEYGGRVSCYVCETKDPFDKTINNDGDEQDLTVWTLSDLCLISKKTGLPTLTPNLHDILPDSEINCALDISKSVISTRRYAPWNSYLKSREQERVVIKAGSVLYYKRQKQHANLISNVIGQYQESGLGRVWVNPHLLSQDIPQVIETVKPDISLDILNSCQPHIQTEWPESLDAEKTNLLRWMQIQITSRDHSKMDKVLEQWKEELKGLYESARVLHGALVGPSASQWSAVRGAAEKARTVEQLTQSLFKGHSPVCGQEGQSTQEGSWSSTGRLSGELISFRHWLRLKLNQKDLNTKLDLEDKLSGTHILKATQLLTKHAQDIAQGSITDAA